MPESAGPAAGEAGTSVCVAGGEAPRGSVSVWITQVPGKPLSGLLVSGREGQSPRQEAVGGLRGRAGVRVAPVGGLSQLLLRLLIHVLRFGSQGQDLTPILMAATVQWGSRGPEVHGRGLSCCPCHRPPACVVFLAGRRPAPIPASSVPCASPPRLIRTQVTRDQGPPLFANGTCKALFLNKFPSRGHRGQGQGQHAL